MKDFSGKYVTFSTEKEEQRGKVNWSTRNNSEEGGKDDRHGMKKREKDGVKEKDEVERKNDSLIWVEQKPRLHISRASSDML